MTQISKSELLLEVWGSFFLAHSLSLQAIEQALSGKVDLSLHEYDVLRTIHRAPAGMMRFSELTAVSVYTKSGISRVSKRLEESGFIEKKKCPNDGRSAFACITPKGESALKATWREYSSAILELLSPLFNSAEATQLQELMERMIQSIQPEALIQIAKQ